MTRCAEDLCVEAVGRASDMNTGRLTVRDRITKMREKCLKDFDAHWGCLEKNNQVCRRTVFIVGFLSPFRINYHLWIISRSIILVESRRGR